MGPFPDVTGAFAVVAVIAVVVGSACGAVGMWVYQTYDVTVSVAVERD